MAGGVVVPECGVGGVRAPDGGVRAPSGWLPPLSSGPGMLPAAIEGGGVICGEDAEELG